MTSKGKRTLAKVIKGNSSLDRMYQIMGRLEKEPEVNDELVYVVDGEKCHTNEIVKCITTREEYHSFYPGRMIIQTDKNTYVADNLVAFNEHSRRGSRLY